MNPKKQAKIIIREAELEENPVPVLYEGLVEVEEKIEQVENKIDTFIGSYNKAELKGDKGDSIKGDTPTDEELTAIIKPLIPDPIPGKSPTSTELLELIKPLIPKVKNGETPSDQRLISLIVPLIPKVKDGSPDTPLQIATKLNTLTEAVDSSVIKGIPKIEDFIKELKNPLNKNRLEAKDIINMPTKGKLDQRWHGGGDTFVAGSNITITSNSNGTKTIASSGGGGTPGGSNTQVQFNDSGVFGGSAGFIFTKANKRVGIGSTVTPGASLDVTSPTLLTIPLIFRGVLNDNGTDLAQWFSSGSTKIGNIRHDGGMGIGTYNVGGSGTFTKIIGANAPASSGSNAEDAIGAIGGTGDFSALGVTNGGGFSYQGGAGASGDISDIAGASSVGGIGGGFSNQAGTGGSVTDVTNTYGITGGNGGSVTIRSGSGGTASGGLTSTGGSGGAITLQGGDAAFGDTAYGSAGAISITGGAEGAGAYSNATITLNDTNNGRVIVGNSSGSSARLSIGVSDFVSNPLVALDMYEGDLGHRLSFGYAPAGGSNGFGMWSDTGIVYFGDGANNGILQLINGGGIVDTQIAAGTDSYFGNKVGIGTQSPSTLLHIYANVNDPTTAEMRLENINDGNLVQSRIRLITGTSVNSGGTGRSFGGEYLVNRSTLHFAGVPGLWVASEQDPDDGYIPGLGFSQHSDVRIYFPPNTSVNYGNMGIGTTTPTAFLHIKAGTTSFAPFKLTTGTLTTTPTSGAVEYTDPDLYFTPSSATRYNLPLVSGAGVQGDIIYASGASIYSRLAKNTTATRYLSNTGTSNNPAWAQVDLTNGVTGALPVANGGTNSAIRFTNNVALTTQGADITTTNFTNGGTAGTYRVGYDLQDTTSDITAGAVTLTISFTDNVGATTITATQVLTGTGRTTGVAYIQLASGNITYATSHTGVFGSAKYALYLCLERLS